MTVWTTWPAPSSLVSSNDDSKVPLMSGALLGGDPGALADGPAVLGAVASLVAFGRLGMLVGPLTTIGLPLALGAGDAGPAAGAAAHPPPIAPMTIAKAIERQKQLGCAIRIDRLGLARCEIEPRP